MADMMATEKQNDGKPMANAIWPAQDWHIERIRGCRLDPTYTAQVNAFLHIRLSSRAEGSLTLPGGATMMAAQAGMPVPRT